MIYSNNKPTLLVCDNTVYVKKLPKLANIMNNAKCGYPYDKTNEHYILDIEDTKLTNKVLEILKKAK